MAKRTNRMAWALAAVLTVFTGMWLQLRQGINIGVVVTEKRVGFLGVRLCDWSACIDIPANTWHYACGIGCGRIFQLRRLGPATVEVYHEFIYYR